MAKEKLLGEAGGRITLYLEGMDCAEEVEIIDKKLKSLEGIANYRVNLIDQSLSLAYEPTLISVQDIVKAIAETGMRARLERVRKEIRPWWQEGRIILLFASGIFTLTGFILSWLGLPHWADRIAFGLAVIVGGYYPARTGLSGLLSLRLNIYTLLIAAAVGAITLGLWHEAALLVFIYSLGSVLETYAVDKARGSLRALMDLVPREALVRRNGQEMTLPVEEVRVGDIIIVRPGEKVPCLLYTSPSPRD